MKSLERARSEIKNIALLLGGFSFAVNLLLLTVPLYMLQIYDRVLPSRSMDTLVFLTIIAVVSLIVLGLMEAVRAVLASRAAARIEVELGADALRTSMETSRLGEADIQPMRNLAAIRTFVSSRTLFALLDLPFAPLFIIILYIIHPILFWLTVVGAVALFGVAWFNQKATSEPSESANKDLNSAMTTAQALSRNAHTLRAMGMTNNAISFWGAHNARSLVTQAGVDDRNAFLSGLARSIRMVLQIAILGVGALLVLKGEMTAGMIFAASIISGRGLQPIDQVIGGWKQFATTWQAWQDLTNALATAGDEVNKTLMSNPEGRIQVDAALVLSPVGVAKPPILNRVSFHLAPGEVLGIVGPSGSGKSTLSRLLVGAQLPQSGTVRIDGTEVHHWDAAQLGQHIGYLGQEVELLPGTVAENIARLAPQPDSAAVLKAARRAQVHELIQNLPNGYDTVIGPGGMGLSGGQRQRIGLARAFYGDPQIMVLDEPNANLDDDGELALQKAMLAARQSGVTMIVITQRKQVLNAVDQILRMHQGNVDFFGTRQEFVKLLQDHRQKTQGRAAANVNPAQAKQQTQRVIVNKPPDLAPSLEKQPVTEAHRREVQEREIESRAVQKQVRADHSPEATTAVDETAPIKSAVAGKGA